MDCKEIMAIYLAPITCKTIDIRHYYKAYTVTLNLNKKITLRYKNQSSEEA